MKKFLPTLVPILTFAVTALAPTVQQAIISFVSAHAVAASGISAAWLIINHWIPSPNQLPSGTSGITATTALFLCALLIVLPLAGCTYSQAQVTSAVQHVESGLKDVQSALPIATLAVSELNALDANAAKPVQNVIDIANAGLPKLIAACDAYLASPSPDAYQAILNATDALSAQFDQQALAILKIQNTQSQTKAIATIALFTTGIHLGLGILEQFASKQQIKAVPAQSTTVSLKQLKPLINREYALRELNSWGYNGAAALQAAGL